MRARYINIIIWVAALVAVWHLGQSYTVTNALFLFAVAGVVPGTNSTLSPDQVLWLLAGILALAIILIFGTNIVRFARWVAAPMTGRRRTAKDFEGRDFVEVAEVNAGVELGVVSSAPVSVEPTFAAPSMPALAAEAPALASVAVPLPAAPKRERAKKQKKVPAQKPKTVLVIRPPKRPSRVLLILRVVGGMLAVGFRGALALSQQQIRKVSPRLRQAWAAARVAVHRAGVRLHILTIKSIIWVCATAIRVWRFAEPYLRRFDNWLGTHYRAAATRLRQHDNYKLGASVGRETVRAVAAARAELRAKLSRAIEK